MKLTYEGRWELRKKIEELLKTVPDGYRIQLDKQLLETLLFEEELFSTLGEDKIGKAPIWSGPFLRKLDLSAVSFDNVKWSLAFVSIGDELIEKYNFLLGDVFEKGDDEQDENIKIDYSYTNAVIDLGKSFDFLNSVDRRPKPLINITNCNLAGVNLSNSNSEDYILALWNCDISNSGLKIDEFCSNVCKCNFENLDLSSIQIDLNDFFDDESIYYVCDVSDFSNFLNTGLRVTGNIDVLNDSQKDILFTAIRDGRLNGCYLNGKLITGLESLQSVQIDKLNEYEKMKADLFAAVTQSIEEQKKSFRR